MDNLYEILGVPRDADAATIRRAFRKKVRKSHPDGGGSTEDFNTLKSAYDILSDPVRRRRYDETGETIDLSTDPHLAKIIEILSIALDQSLVKLNASGSWRDSEILSAMTDILIQGSSETSKQKKAFEFLAEQSKRIKGKFQVADGDNVIELAINKRIEICNNQIEQLAEKIDIIDEAIGILKKTSVEKIMEITESEQIKSSSRAKLFDFSTLIKFND
jgi:curved DNA-binding protein CbpA